jgi:hypothetical protein
MVCPMFMWSKASKEANIFENNFRASMTQILAHPEPSKDYSINESLQVEEKSSFIRYRK